MVSVITRCAGGDFKTAVKSKKQNPQQIIQSDIKSAIDQIEKDLSDSSDPPVVQFKGTVVLARLVESLEQSLMESAARVSSEAGFSENLLIPQLLRNEINAIKPFLVSSCHKQCNQIYCKLKADGTTWAVFKNGEFERKLAA